MKIPTRKLKSGYEMPVIGLGTWQLKGDDALRSVSCALETGYRAIDTADVYGNHKEVGKALDSSTLARGEIFVTSKVWRENLKKKDILESCKRNLDELDLDYLDLYLVHWPNKNIPMEETMEGMMDLVSEGLVRSIGVSNFTKNHIKDALATGAEISINQVEYHPTLNQDDLRGYCLDNDVYLTAYSSLAFGHELELDEINKIANKYDVSPAQVVISWTIQKQIFAIPRSSKESHIKDNLESLRLELTEEDMNVLNNLNEDYRVVNPDFNEFDY